MCHFSTISGGKQNCNNNNTFKILGSFPIQLLSSFHFHSLCFPCLSVCHPWKPMYVWCVCLCWTGVLGMQSHTMSVSTHSYDVFHQLFQFLCVCLCDAECVHGDVFVRQVFRGKSLSLPACFFMEPLKLSVVQLTLLKCFPRQQANGP